LPLVLNSSISQCGGTGRRQVSGIARRPLYPALAIIAAAAAIVVDSSGGATTAAALEVVGACPDVNVVLGWETSAGRGAVS